MAHVLKHHVVPVNTYQAQHVTIAQAVVPHVLLEQIVQNAIQVTTSNPVSALHVDQLQIVLHVTQLAQHVQDVHQGSVLQQVRVS